MNFSKTLLRPTLSAVTLFSLALGLISFMPQDMNAQIRRERPPKTESTETLTGDKAVESLKNSGGYDSLRDAFQNATASNGGGIGTENLFPGGTYEEVSLTASDGAAGDKFGWSVAVSGDTAVVGSWYDNVGSNTGQGSAYVFVRSETSWTAQQRLTASDGAALAHFGSSVSIDGDTAVIGAYDAKVGPSAQGAAYVFVRSGTTWTEEKKLVASDGVAGDYFGNSVALSGDTAIVGAYYASIGPNGGQGSAYVFVRSGTNWTQQQKLTASDGESNSQFGWSVAVANDTAVIGANYDDVGPNIRQGSAYIFIQSGGVWAQQQKLTASDGTGGDLFGSGVSVSGRTVVVGAAEDEIGANVDQGSAYVFIGSSMGWTQQQKLTAYDGANGDRFGISVAIWGETAVVGALQDDVGSNLNQGSAYVFVRSGTSWTLGQKLTASDGSSFDVFGCSVAIFGDTIVVGATNGDIGANVDQGSAKIFQTKMSIAKKVASDGTAGDLFGASVAVSGDTVVVGASNANSNKGAAYVFVRSGTTWTQQQKLTASDGATNDLFGYSVAVSGDTAIVGAYGTNSLQGSAYVFVRSGTTWTQQQKLIASDGSAGGEFGRSVTASGNTAAVGAVYNSANGGATYVFVRSGTTWTEQQKLIASDATPNHHFGYSIALYNETLVVGAYGADSSTGAAYVFVRFGTTWTQQQKLTPSDGATYDAFGVSVSLSGDTAVIGAAGASTYKGATYVFVRSGTTWTQEQKLMAFDRVAGDYFGWSVAVSGNTTVIGAYAANSYQGSAYVFGRSGTVWTQERKLTASNGAAYDQFGDSVAVSGNTAVVGAQGLLNNLSLAQAQVGGSAYMYYWGSVTPTAAGSRLSGRVLSADGRGLRNAMVVATDSAGAERTVQTGTFGNFTFSDLPSGDTYVLTVRARLYQFAPQVIYVGADLDGLRMQPATGSRL